MKQIIGDIEKNSYEDLKITVVDKKKRRPSKSFSQCKDGKNKNLPSTMKRLNYFAIIFV